MKPTPPVVFEYDARAGEKPSDELFFERLETFMEKCLGDIRAFAQRELRPYEETRRCIAQWHAKYLFQPSADPSIPTRSAQVRSTLCNTSSILESLSETAGVQSFLLAIDPNDPSDGGFLGGSLIGREFWRGMRGGGDTGARSFKVFYNSQSQTMARAGLAAERHIPTPPPLKGKPEGSARSLKNELYETVRNALRTTSGVRNAEMKWTNPERLDTYGVRLVGWPDGVPAQNPSMLKSSQNKLVHEAMLSGSMRFEKIRAPAPGDSGEEASGQHEDANEDFSWAYDADARLPSPPPPAERVPTRPPSPAQRPLMVAAPFPPDISEPAPNAWTVDPAAGVENLASYNVEYAWGDEFRQGVMEDLGAAEWESDPHSQIERPRKRPRSEEPGSAVDGHVLK